MSPCFARSGLALPAGLFIALDQEETKCVQTGRTETEFTNRLEGGSIAGNPPRRGVGGLAPAAATAGRLDGMVQDAPPSSDSSQGGTIAGPQDNSDTAGPVMASPRKSTSDRAQYRQSEDPSRMPATCSDVAAHKNRESGRPQRWQPLAVSRARLQLMAGPHSSAAPPRLSHSTRSSWSQSWTLFARAAGLGNWPREINRSIVFSLRLSAAATSFF